MIARTKSTGPDELSMPVRRCLFLGEQTSHDRFEAAIPPLTTSLQSAWSIIAENATTCTTARYKWIFLLACALGRQFSCRSILFFNMLLEKKNGKNSSGFILSIFECFWNYSGKIYHHVSFQSSQVKTLLNLRLEVVRKDVSHTVYYQLFLKCSFNLRFLITNK